MKINNVELTQLTSLCFDLSMDGGIQLSDQKEFLALGKRLRGSLLNLLTAEFEKGTEAVVNANKMINDLNKSMSNIKQVLEKTAQVISQIGKLVSILDDLLKVATVFV